MYLWFVTTSNGATKVRQSVSQLQEVCSDLKARHKVMGKRAIDLVSHNPDTYQHSTMAKGSDQRQNGELYNMFQGEHGGFYKGGQKQWGGTIRCEDGEAILTLFF